MGFKSRPSGKRVYLTFPEGKSHRVWDVTPDTLKALRSSPLFDDIDFSWSYAAKGATSPAGFGPAKGLQFCNIHFDDLHVRGDLELEEHLTVLGNLRVDGAIIQDTHVGLMVTGDLQARAFDVAGLTWVLGKFQGDYVHLARWANFDADGGVEARLVTRDAYEAYICDFKTSHFLDGVMLGQEEFQIAHSCVERLVPQRRCLRFRLFDP